MAERSTCMSWTVRWLAITLAFVDNPPRLQPTASPCDQNSADLSEMSLTPGYRSVRRGRRTSQDTAREINGKSSEGGKPAFPSLKALVVVLGRSEERRVGKECRYRW